MIRKIRKCYFRLIRLDKKLYINDKKLYFMPLGLMVKYTHKLQKCDLLFINLAGGLKNE